MEKVEQAEYMAHNNNTIVKKPRQPLQPSQSIQDSWQLKQDKRLYKNPAANCVNNYLSNPQKEECNSTRIQIKIYKWQLPCISGRHRSRTNTTANPNLDTRRDHVTQQ